MAVVLPSSSIDAVTRSLVDRFQRDFPLLSRPFAEIGLQLGLAENEVIERLAALQKSGAVSRVGAVVRPHTAGASTLAAVAAPPAAVEEVAAIINRFAGVNHNYERENRWNLWFVVTGRDWAAVNSTLAGIEEATRLRVLNLPLEKSYHIDLGFALFGPSEKRRQPAPTGAQADAGDRRVLAAIEQGLALVPQPFLAAAERCGLDEAEVIRRIDAMQVNGVISRFGVVVRHRAFGYTANAMAVWDIDDTCVDEVAEIFAREAGVTLCYRRPRRLPDWRFNLFTMIHGTSRPDVHAVIHQLAGLAGGSLRARDTLFSARCFKQRGAVFSDAAAGDAA